MVARALTASNGVMADLSELLRARWLATSKTRSLGSSSTA